FDTMQETLKCCGTYNYTDWFGVYRESQFYSVPVSCCINPETCNNLDIPKKEDEARKIIYTDGCADKLKDTVQENMMAIIIVCIVIGLIEITGIFCSCGLMQSVKNEYEVV
ncbi:hypothetical protein, partial [Salmonella sp. s55004]|uniref:hypothetical protein n=1 Tax=Salmonella sp. s55004 TaxID=3159675 RepID=UPI003980C06E